MLAWECFETNYQQVTYRNERSRMLRPHDSLDVVQRVMVTSTAKQQRGHQAKCLTVSDLVRRNQEANQLGVEVGAVDTAKCRIISKLRDASISGPPNASGQLSRYRVVNCRPEWIVPHNLPIPCRKANPFGLSRVCRSALIANEDFFKWLVDQTQKHPFGDSAPVHKKIRKDRLWPPANGSSPPLPNSDNTSKRWTLRRTRPIVHFLAKLSLILFALKN